VAGWIEDRWLKKRKDPKTGRRERTALWGTKTKRYRVCGIPGVRKRSFDTLEDAKTWLARAITDTKRLEFIDPRDGGILLADYIEEHWWPNRSDPQSTAGPMWSRISRHIIGASIGRLPMNTIGRQHLMAWVTELRGRGLADSTIRLIWRNLSTIFRSAVGDRIPRNPCRDNLDVCPVAVRGTKTRAWTAEEVRAIRENLPGRYRVLSDLGVMAGLRQGEALAFSPDDIDEERGLIHLRRQLRWDPSRPYFKLPKGKRERDIPLSPGLLKAVLAHMEEYPPVKVTLPWQGPGNGGRATATVKLLVVTAHGNPVHASGWNKLTLKPALAAAGLIAPYDEEADGSGWEPSRDKMHHRWRHTYASVQLAAGEDPVSLSHWMGHASPEITLRIYAHFLPDNGTRGRTAVDAWLGAA